MFPPVFQVATSDSDVLALLGSKPTRLFLFGEATQNTVKPYAVWQLVSGSPYNYLNDLPDVDRMTTQIDVYATSVSSARNVAMALRDAFEASRECYVVSWRGETKDVPTNLFRVSFDLEWHVAR